MKKLKVYKKCDFRLIEMCSAHEVMGASQPQNNYVDSNKGDISDDSGNNTGEAWAPVFRDGIWDE